MGDIWFTDVVIFFLGNPCFVICFGLLTIVIIIIIYDYLTSVIRKRNNLTERGNYGDDLVPIYYPKTYITMFLLTLLGPLPYAALGEIAVIYVNHQFNVAYADHGRSVEGRVVDRNTYSSGRTGSSHSCTVYYEYTVETEGVKQVYTLNETEPGECQQGASQVAVVRYLPEAPSRGYVNEMRPIDLWDIFPAVTWWVLLWFTPWFLFLGRLKKNYLTKVGQMRI